MHVRAIVSGEDGLIIAATVAAGTEPYGVRGYVRGDGGSLATHIQLSTGLQSMTVHDSRGAHVATVHGQILDNWLGEGLSSDGRSLFVDVPVESPQVLERRVVRGLAGSLITETHGGALGRRIYHDCGGTMPIVYSPQDRAFGGSASMILGDADYAARLLPDRVQRVVMREGRNGWISGTLTAHAGVSRLLANHYLDLDDFTPHRFWPTCDLLAAEPPALEDAAQQVAVQMAGFTRAVQQKCSIALGLTAGIDSRTVLASFQGATDRLLCMTMDDSGTIDIEIARRLCARAGTPHILPDSRCADDQQLQRWDRLVGQALRSSNREIHPTLDALDADVLMSGLFGELSRCFLYKHDWRSIDQGTPDAANLLRRLRQPLDTDMLADTEAWLAPLAGLPRSIVLDLAYLELRMSSWAMGQAPATRVHKWVFMPLAQWPIHELFLTQRLDDKGNARMLPRVGSMLWPELLEIPVNRYGDWRDLLGPLRKLYPHNSVVHMLRRHARTWLVR